MIGQHVVKVYGSDLDTPTGAGTDISCLVDEVSIRHGRQDTASQVEPSSATVDFTVGPGAPLPAIVDIGAWVVVTTTLSGATHVRFTGRLTDMSIGWDDEGENTPEAGMGQMVAVSVLADYARRVIGDEPFPQELDGARVARVLALAGLELDPATSDPGVLEVIPRDVDARAALEVAQGTAQSSGGLIWETTTGDIRYADSEHRRGAVVALDLDACQVLVTPTWSRNLSALVNEVSLGYGVATPADPETDTPAMEAPRYYAVNTDSQRVWGRYDYSVTTELATLADASALASLILVQDASPVWMLSALPVDVFGLDATATAKLLGLDVHSLVRVTGLPATGPTPTVVAAWVEGWTERLAWGVHDLELTVSDYCWTAPPERWDDLNPTTTWDAWNATQTWDDIACTGGPVADQGRWNDVAATTRWDQVDPSVDWDETTGGVPVP